MHVGLKPKNKYYLTFNELLEFEKKYKINLTIPEKILLTNLGITEQILQILTNSQIQFKVINQKELNNVVDRKVQIFLVDSRKILLTAISKIFLDKLPSYVINDIRLHNIGIGNIIMKYGLETFKQITEIGYIPKTSCIFRKYNLLYNSEIICKIKEIFYFEKNLDLL
ncbi:MAG: hypothetical protein ACPKQO_07340 [Nitrososphaeraceae archaeon]